MLERPALIGLDDALLARNAQEIIGSLVYLTIVVEIMAVNPAGDRHIRKGAVLAHAIERILTPGDLGDEAYLGIPFLDFPLEVAVIAQGSAPGHEDALNLDKLVHLVVINIYQCHALTGPWATAAGAA